MEDIRGPHNKKRVKKKEKKEKIERGNAQPMVFDSHLNRLKKVIDRNKVIFNTAQYAMSFGSFFFPVSQETDILSSHHVYHLTSVVVCNHRCHTLCGRTVTVLFSHPRDPTPSQGGTSNYDLIVEGLTSLTNIVGFMNEYTSQRDPETLK